ncbi:putative N-acetyltransferase YhbS [Deinococcus metalli]|uniref:N-acetyltransferase n=1 Tax=Deinococcus metalli TaxID=1141878 RepID=A0A7W8KIS1_9DEIO|nr:GNAT family N-acetyltransferase [Deinococcus metalli]MBB5378925.1 putative N-acetyltransferase YhbS [Deinococcus metalli]GHF62796.1 N-acetyltransferase [Deinococcus metalli]
MPDPTLRPYRPDDRAACLALFASNMPHSFLPHEHAEFVEWLDGLDTPAADERAEYTVAQDGGRIVACGGIWWTEHASGFAWGMVERGLQRRGYGTLLVQARLERLRALGVAEVALDTSQHTAPYYARFGFREVRRVPDGYGPGLDRVDMVARLERSGS